MLKRVSIQNFKSLKDVTLDLQKINLLIGPNNSGKTNFLKALEFAGSWIKGSLKQSIINSSIAFKSLEDDSLQKQTSWLLSVESDAQSGWANYQVKIDLKRDSFEYEESTWLSDESDLNSNKNNYSVLQAHPHWGITRDGIVEKDAQYFPSKFLLAYAKATPFLYPGNILILFDKIIIYKPDPNKLDKPAPVGRGESFVAGDASNLIAFFDRIRDEYPNTFAQIKADLSKCVPEFTEINFQNVESSEELVKQFGDKTFKRIGFTDGRQKTIYWADELSEGTLYFIALLCIINQPNPPKLLLLEEPEKGIHPRRIREVMDFIRRLASEKDIQVIMTTHSPLLLDEFAESPQSVFLFDKDDEGATIVRNLQRDVIEPANQENERLGIPPVPYTEALGEYWTIGFLGGIPHEAA